MGYRPTTRPQDENDVDLAGFYGSIATRHNLGDYSCSFNEMIERGHSTAGYFCAGLSDDALDRPIVDRPKEVEHYLALRRRVEAIVATRTTADWQTTLEAAGVPAAGVKLPLELLDDEQPLANGMLHDLTHPVLGPVRVLAPPLGMDGGGFVPAQATAPFGSETRAILGELGFSSAEVDALLAEGVTRDRLKPRG